MYRSITALALTVVILTACGRSESPPPPAAEAPATSPPAATPGPAASEPASAPAAPQADAAAVQALLTPDETLQVITLDGSNPTTESGEVAGYKATAWAVAVPAGKTLSVTFKPSNANLYMNVVDAADTSGAAVHRGEVDGATASISATKDSTYLIRTFQPRAMARRDEKGTYTLDVSVQ